MKHFEKRFVKGSEKNVCVKTEKLHVLLSKSFFSKRHWMLTKFIWLKNIGVMISTQYTSFPHFIRWTSNDLKKYFCSI